MEATWTKIKNKLAEIAPEINEKLNPGVTDEEVNLLESTIGKKLPEAFVSFYKIHNGQESNAPGLIYAEELLSFKRIISEWTIWKQLLDDKVFEDENGPYDSEADIEIKPDWWNPAWIPITYDGSGNHYCLDLDPTEEGNYGQIIRMWHDDSERPLESDSFEEWIKDYAQQMEEGNLTFSEDYYGINND